MSEIILACRIMMIAAGIDPASGAERYEPRFVCEEVAQKGVPARNIFRHKKLQKFCHPQKLMLNGDCRG